MKKGIFIWILIGLAALQLAGCKTKQGDVPQTSQAEVVQEESHHENEEDNEENRPKETKEPGRDLGTQIEPAYLFLEEKELTVEEDRFFYGAFMVGLPEGMTIKAEETAWEGQVVYLYGQEKDEDNTTWVEPRIGLACYYAEYEHRDALLVELLKLTSGTKGKIMYEDEEARQYTYWMTKENYQYYAFVREEEVYLVEALYGGYEGDKYTFPWLLEEKKTVGWADTGEKAGYAEEAGYADLTYMLFSVEEGMDFLVVYHPIKEKIDQTAVYLEGYYRKPYQTIEIIGMPDEWGMKDWNFDGCRDIAFSKRVFLWNEDEEQFVEAQLPVEGVVLEEAELYPETETIWTSDIEYGTDDYFETIETETLWQWEEEALVKVRECRLKKTEEEIHIRAYEETEDELLFDEVVLVKSGDREAKIQKLYESFYEGLVSEDFYLLEHNRIGKTEYIPAELVEMLTQAIEEEKEYEVLSALINDRELSKEEIAAIARENTDIRLELSTAGALGTCLMVEADLDNDGIMDILSQSYYGGTGGFVDFILFQGKADGSCEETERFGSVKQEFGVITFAGKNYLCRTEFDYAKKIYSGLSLICYEEGRMVEEIYLNLELDSYDMQLIECAAQRYEPIVDEMIQDGPLYKEKIDEYKTILGSAEEKWEGGELKFCCDLDNDGKKELYDKYIWTTSSMGTRDYLALEGEQGEEGLALLEGIIWEAVRDEGTYPIMMWVDTYGTQNIVHVAYTTGLYDFELAGYLIKEAEYHQVYRIQGKANCYVDCIRYEPRRERSRTRG